MAEFTLGANEMLASFLWAVGEDAIARPHPTSEDDPCSDDDDGTEPAAHPMHAHPMQAHPMHAHPMQVQPSCDLIGCPVQGAPSVGPQGAQCTNERGNSWDARAAAIAATPSPQPQPPLPSAAFNMPMLGHSPLQPFGQGAFGNPLMPSACNVNAFAAAAAAAMFGGGGLLRPCAYPLQMPILPIGMGAYNFAGPQVTLAEDEAKSLHRLQRKAESARVSRTRKKHYVATLEVEVAELRDQLRLTQQQMQQQMHMQHMQHMQQQTQASAPTPPSASELDGQSFANVKVQQLSEILQRQSIDRLTSDVNSLVEQFVQNQRRRQEQINFHFSEIFDLLDTGPQYQMAFWDAIQASRAHCQTGASAAQWQERAPGAVPLEGEGAAAAAAAGGAELGALQAEAQGGGAAAGSEAAGVAGAGVQSTGSELLDLLVSALQLDGAQVTKLEACRKRCEELQPSREHCQRLVQAAHKQVVFNVVAAQHVMDNMRGVLSPQQVARFLVWVEKHKRQLEVFNSISEG